ncbi:hypothetical protein ABLE94_08340 [Gordonia sp. VNK1]
MTTVFREAGVAHREPKKKPRSAWRRFVYPAPDACWQLDGTEYVGDCIHADGPGGTDSSEQDKIRASDAVEGTSVRPIDCILSCTLIGS